jgi:hypothetical protein
MMPAFAGHPVCPHRSPIFTPMNRTIKFELIFAALTIGLSLIVLPAAIYWSGVLVLEPYAGGPQVGAFYGDFYRFLGAGSAAAWLLALGPYVLLLLLRILFSARGARAGDDDEPTAAPRRTEPKITL